MPRCTARSLSSLRPATFHVLLWQRKHHIPRIRDLLRTIMSLSPLLDLPSEIFDHICHDVVLSNGPEYQIFIDSNHQQQDKHYRSVREHTRKQLSQFLTCRQFYKHLKKAFYSQNDFAIHIEPIDQGKTTQSQIQREQLFNLHYNLISKLKIHLQLIWTENNTQLRAFRDNNWCFLDGFPPPGISASCRKQVHAVLERLGRSPTMDTTRIDFAGRSDHNLTIQDWMARSEGQQVTVIEEVLSHHEDFDSHLEAYEPAEMAFTSGWSYTRPAE